MVTHGRAREDKVFEGRRDVKAGQDRIGRTGEGEQGGE
jgi:hypothetical protein